MPKGKTKETNELTIKTLIEDSQKLDTLCKLSFPTKTAYWLQRILKKAKSEVAEFNEMRESIVKEMGDYDSEKDEYTVKKENLEAFYAKLKELQSVEIDLGINKIKLDTLDQNMQIQPELLLSWVFEE